MRTVTVLGIGFDDAPMDELTDAALHLMDGRDSAYAVTPNSEIVLSADRDRELKHILNSASLVLPDGIGVVYASKILGTEISAKAAGADFAHCLLEKMSERAMSVYLLGAKPGVAEKAAGRIGEKYPGIVVSGWHDGYFSDDSAIIKEINTASPDFLMVCLGAPKQEYWMYSNRDRLNVGLMCGLGGVLDVYAGVVERAPQRWIDLGLEWLYRLIKQPKRFGRMARLPLILVKAFFQRVKTGLPKKPR